MPQCNSCNKDFPNRITIDGKERILSSRKFCLDCSPFGLHNTSKNPTRKKNRKDKRKFICKDCGKLRNESGTNLRCSVCKTTERRRRNKLKAIEYLGGQCELCGYSRSLAALEFHHKDPLEKSFILGFAWHKSWTTILSEINKCRLLCANCHREQHN